MVCVDQLWLDLAHARDIQGGIPSCASSTLPVLFDPPHGMVLWDLHALLGTLLQKPLGCKSQLALPA